MADQWMVVFGPSAVAAAASLQGQLQLVGTASFELLKRFDAVTGFSRLFREAVILTRQTLEYLAKNMEVVIALFGALVGAGAGFLMLQLFSKLPTLIMATVAAFRTLTATIITLDLVTLATGWGALLSVLAKIAAVTIGAVVGYNLLESAIRTAQTPMNDWIEGSKAWLDTQEKMAQSHKQTTNEIRKGTQERLVLLKVELSSAQEMLRLSIKSLEIERDKFNIKPSMAAPFGGAFLAPAPGDSPDVKAARERLQNLENLRKEMEDVLKRLGQLKVPGDPAGEEPGTQWTNWAEKIKQSLREVIGLGEQLKASELGQGAIEQARGMAKAIEMMSDQPEKGRGSLTGLAKALKDAGFEGANLTEQLAKLYLLIEQRKDTLKELEALPGKAATAGEAIAKMFDVVEARRQAATTGDVGSTTQLEKQLVTMEGYFEVLKKMGMTQEHINFLVGTFRKQWSDMETAEEGSKTVEKLTRKLEQLDNQLGDKSVRVMEEYHDRIELVWEAFGHGVGTLEDLERRLVMIEDDMNRKVIDRMSVFGRSVREAFREIEDQTASALARMTRGQEAGWQQMFDAILQTIYEFMYKVMVIQPIMEALFGQLYTQKSNTPQGLFEAFLRGLVPGAASSLGGSVASAGGVDEAGMIDALGGGYVGDQAEILGFARGGSFDVGGSGSTDSKFVGFRATPGEHVEVTPPGQNSGQSVKVIVRNESGVAMEGTQGPTSFDAEGAVVELFLRRLSRDAAARERLSTLTRSPRF